MSQTTTLNGLPSREEAASRMGEIEARDVENSREQGARDGVAWVRRSATKRQLRRLQKAVEMSDGNGQGDGDYFIGVAENGGNRGARDAIARGIFGEDTDHRDLEPEDWTKLFGPGYSEHLDDRDYLASFVDAALAEFVAIESA